MLNKDCNQKQNNSQETLASKEINSNQEGNSIKFTYRASTRGFFEILWITKDTITISKDRDLIKRTSFSYPESDWDELMALMNDLDLKNLENLDAPSKKFQYDGAAMATFKVNTNNEEFTTSGFDNGAPPKAIEAIVNKLLSIKSSVEKP
jgi:hypothetical protein